MCSNRSHSRVLESGRTLPAVYLWHWKAYHNCFLPWLVWGQEHKGRNSNYRPAPKCDEHSCVWPYFLPLFLCICLHSALHLGQKSLILKQNGHILHSLWYFMENNLRHLVGILSILTSEMVAYQRFFWARRPWTHLSFTWTHFDCWCSMPMR